MKPKLFLSITLFTFISFFAFAQETTTTLLIYDNVKKNVEKSDADILDPAKNIKPSIWIKRAQAYEKAYEVNIQQLYIGMSPLQVQIFYKNPEKQTVDGKQVEIYEGRTKVVYKDGVVESFEDIAPIHENPLKVALEAYQKAVELDTKGKVGGKIADDLANIKDKFFYLASVAFSNEKDYKKAFDFFELAVDAMEMPAFEAPIDTNLYYNTGLAANIAKDYKNAAKYYSKAINAGYSEPEIFVYTRDIYVELGDTTEALNVLKKGFQLHPDNKPIVLNMINLFIESNKTQEALDFINEAKKTSESSDLYFAEGSLLEETKKLDEAKTAYKKALEIDPQNVNANYNLGVMYFNEGVEIINKASDLKDDAEYNKQKEIAMGLYRKGLGFLEKALEGEPNQKIIMGTLKTVYYRLGDEAKVKEMEDRMKYAD